MSSQITEWELDAYVFLPDLVNPTDTSLIVSAYPQMVLEKVKELSFALDNKDDLATAAKQRFLDAFARAAREDGAKEWRGRVMRMGGA